MQIRQPYPFDRIEQKWQRHWLEQKTFRAADPGSPESRKPKYYILDMFPYPSGEGLHVGHPEGYTATDIMARFKRMRGFNVLHPMGWDAFGLPAEQFAIKTGRHPRVTTENNIANFKRQIQSLGFSYDWDREVNTTDPGYFKWTQWIFLQLYNAWFNPATSRAESIETLPIPEELQTEKDQRSYLDAHRLAYVAEAPVNWCPELGTVLANEEVTDGKSEVGGFPVIRKPMRQWMLRITAYAERLLNDLTLLDWPEALKEMQRNWIGRSEGALVTFSATKSRRIEVFTTRPDTLFGATYLVLSPEHPLVPTLTTPKQRKAVEAYVEASSRKSDLERTELAKEKSGVFTGGYARNPVYGARDPKGKIPIWVADYVLASYGTGAIMAVPAHDERDHAFAEKFELPILQVVQPPTNAVPETCFSGEGVAIHSGFLDGKTTSEAKSVMLDWLEKNQCGKRRVNFKLRDWLFSRQRYWGEPFPIIWRDGMHEALSEEALPVLPPEMTDFKPTSSGEPPLARAEDWVKLPDGSVRETNTMPQWAGSCWYYLRYLDATNGSRFCDPEKEKYWMGEKGVDLYVGGAEHAVLHLLYARFWHKVLFDLGHVSSAEPFHKLVNQGLILGEDGLKMSKSIGNVVNPDDVVAEYGADSFRLYEMFMGPLEQSKPWTTQGIKGVHHFLGRVWRLLVVEDPEGDSWKLSPTVQEAEPTEAGLKRLHATIQKVTQDYENLRFNTAISALMEWVNETMKETAAEGRLPHSVAKTFVQLLHPMAPHLAEELWSLLGEKDSLSISPWPGFDPGLLVESSVEIVLQINGKVREKMQVPAGMVSGELSKHVLESEQGRRILDGRLPNKVIAVPDRLVNFVLPASL